MKMEEERTVSEMKESITVVTSGWRWPIPIGNAEEEEWACRSLGPWKETLQALVEEDLRCPCSMRHTSKGCQIGTEHATP